MDSSPTPWLHETELENLNLQDDGEFNFLDYLDEDLVALMGEGVSPENNSSSSLINVESTTPNPNPNPNSLSSFCPSSSAPVLLNFGNPNSPPRNTNYDTEEEPKRPKNMKATARIRPPSQTQDHILAERRRREQLSHYFVALSKIVPGLKKMDKTSIMGDTITHLKYLQERVKSLEEEARNKSIQSVVLVKNTSSNDDNTLLEIEARLCDAQMLIKIECEYRKGLLVKLIAQLEKLNLTITTAHSLRFGLLALEITIITKMEKEFNSSVNQVLTSLHVAITNHSPICT